MRAQGGGIYFQVRVIRYDATIILVFVIFIQVIKFKGRVMDSPVEDRRIYQQ